MENKKDKIKNVESLIDMLPEDIKTEKKDEINEIKSMLNKISNKINLENSIDK